MPTLVIGNGEEYVHPLRYAAQLKDLIPGAALQVVTSKTVDKTLYQSQFCASLASILTAFDGGRMSTLLVADIGGTTVKIGFVVEEDTANVMCGYFLRAICAAPIQ
jgi:hypothetical protein